MSFNCDECKSRIFDGVYHFCGISYDEIPCEHCPLDTTKSPKGDFLRFWDFL